MSPEPFAILQTYSNVYGSCMFKEAQQTDFIGPIKLIMSWMLHFSFQFGKCAFLISIRFIINVGEGHPGEKTTYF